MKKILIMLLALLVIGGVFISCKPEPPTYTVSFNNNEGTGSMDSISGKAGTNVTIPAGTGDMYKQNYRFICWNTEEDGDGTDYVGEEVIENIQADLTLYAQWESLYEILESDDWTCTTTAEALDMDNEYIPATDVIIVTMTTDDDGSFSITFTDTTKFAPTDLHLSTVEGTYSFKAGSETEGSLSGTMTYNPDFHYDPDAVIGTLYLVDDYHITIDVTEVGEDPYDPPIRVIMSRPEA